MATETTPKYDFRDTQQFSKFCKASGLNLAMAKTGHEGFEGKGNVKIVDKITGQIVANVSRKVSELYEAGELDKAAIGDLLISVQHNPEAIDPKTGLPYESGLLGVHIKGESVFDMESAIDLDF